MCVYTYAEREREYDNGDDDEDDDDEDDEVGSFQISHFSKWHVYICLQKSRRTRYVHIGKVARGTCTSEKSQGYFSK